MSEKVRETREKDSEPPRKEKRKKVRVENDSDFDISMCAIPTVWCGQGEIPRKQRNKDSYYFKKGTPYECMQKGFGAGMITERKTTMDENSLQQIKYVGETYEDLFISMGIENIDDLQRYALENDRVEFSSLLDNVLVKKGGAKDTRAYNSVLAHLYRRGVKRLPSCISL